LRPRQGRCAGEPDSARGRKSGPHVLSPEGRGASLRAINIHAAVRRFTLALLGSCAVLLAACEEQRRREDAIAVGLTNPELRHPIGFNEHRQSLDVEVPIGVEGLSPNQHADVYRFLERYRREANSRLVILVPAAPRDPASIAQSLQDIQRHVVEARIDYRVGRGPQQSGAGVPTIRIAYRRPVAEPPSCDKWGENVGRNEARVPYPNFGCATQRNTAVMVDNARDLQRPQGEDPRSSERRGVTWSGYVGTPGKGDGDDAAKKAAPMTKK
jgi:pilus assembly protein CpaD